MSQKKQNHVGPFDKRWQTEMAKFFPCHQTSSSIEQPFSCLLKPKRKRNMQIHCSVWLHNIHSRCLAWFHPVDVCYELSGRCCMVFNGVSEFWTWPHLAIPVHPRAFQCVFVPNCISYVARRLSMSGVPYNKRHWSLTGSWCLWLVTAALALCSSVDTFHNSRLCKILLAMALPESQEAACVVLQTMLSEHMWRVVTSGHKWVQTFTNYHTLSI